MEPPGRSSPRCAGVFVELDILDVVKSRRLANLKPLYAEPRSLSLFTGGDAGVGGDVGHKVVSTTESYRSLSGHEPASCP